MTIYNKTFDPITRADKWQRHVVHEVFWQSTNSSAPLYKGLTRQDTGSIYLPFNANFMTYFVDPITFQTNPVGYWTIQNGDIIVKGTIPDEITKQSDLERKHSDVLNISGFNINNFGSSNMQHIQIVGV
jgi:hypothetical protein